MAFVSTSAPLSQASVAGKGIVGFLATLYEGYQQYRVYRSTLDELRALSGRELADLGLNRSMIQRAALEAAYGKAVK